MRGTTTTRMHGLRTGALKAVRIGRAESASHEGLEADAVDVLAAECEVPYPMSGAYLLLRDMVPMVRPWKLCWKAIMLGL